LSTWNQGAAKEAILSFVDQTCGDGSANAVPVAERVAVFDNDGTLWCEKPMPIQLDFILRRLAEMAEVDPDPARPAGRARGPQRAADASLKEVAVRRGGIGARRTTRSTSSGGTYRGPPSRSGRGR
jgi:hypothetical protein